MCVIFQLFYSVTVDSFWQFRINSFLGCALVLRGRRRQRDIQCPLDTAGYPEIQRCTLYTCTVVLRPMPHGILLVSPKNSSVWLIFIVQAGSGRGWWCRPGMVTITSGHGRGHRGRQRLTPHTRTSKSDQQPSLTMHHKIKMRDAKQ